jgi:hypothetical protein
MLDAAKFAVTPGELSGLAGGFSGLIAELQCAVSQVGSGSAGCAGAAELEDAISSFIADWSTGLSDLHGSLGDLQQRLTGAVSSYVGADTGVSSSFHS